MSNVIKKLELQMQMAKIEAAKFEMLHKIEIRKEDIERLEHGVKLQDEAYAQVLNQLNDLKD